MADNKIANAIKFLKGEEKSLPATKTEGQVYFAYKNVGTAEKPSYTGAIYIDTPIGGIQNRIKMTANADIADKAFNDSAGLNIRNTYLSSLGYTDDGKQTILIKGSGNNQTRIALPIASTTKSGIVTTDAQSFSGTKTFTAINSTNLTVTGSSGFSYTGIETATGNKARPVWFAYDNINGKPVVNANFTYNPATQTLKVANLSGTADKAINDSAGYDIRNTYINNITVNGSTLTFTKGSGATSSITLQDANNAVTQTAIKSSDYTNWRAVLWGASKSATEGFTPTTITDCAFTSDTLTFQPSSGTLKAKIFKGSLSGNAETATSASKAINDGANQNIANTYVKYKSIKFSAAADKVYLLEGNGAGSVTATSGSNISTAIIPAATDKAAGVITAAAQTFSGDKTFNNSIIVNDCLVSKTIAGTEKSRFIILPKVPYFMIDSTHDTPTYFKALLKWICTNYPNKKKYSFIGLANPNVESNVLIHIYDTGVINKEGYPEYSTGLFKKLGGALCTFGTFSYNYYCRDTLMADNNFAGSASPGGAATSANKLNTNAGSATRPVYFSGGIPVQCNDILANSISGKSASTDAINWVAGNEIRFTKPSHTSPKALHFGLAWADSSKTKLISEYRFDGGDGQLTQVTASQFNGPLNGNANTATALTSSAGSSTQPVYFSGGKPVACTYTINASVPSGAKFTDTNTWRPLGTTADTACAGNDSRLSNARPASDVYAWAKASTKPTYSWGEITGKPSTFTPSSHTHDKIMRAEHLDTVDKLNAFKEANAFKYATVALLDGLNGLTKNDGIILSMTCRDATSYGQQIFIDDSGPTIAHRYNGNNNWSEWIHILDSKNYTSYTVTKSGSGASGTWGINVSGSSASCTGNAATAAKLQTARTISLTGSVTGSGTFDGSGNLSITTSTNHSHSQYLPLAGGMMTGSIGYGAKGYCYVGSGTSDAANMVGGELNNLVISSWQGISFTTTCSSTFTSKNAVSIDCRNGVLAAASLRVGNGSGSTINFCTNGGTAAPGAKIVAYSDRIEFVFA